MVRFFRLWIFTLGALVGDLGLLTEYHQVDSDERQHHSNGFADDNEDAHINSRLWIVSILESFCPQYSMF